MEFPGIDTAAVPTKVQNKSVFDIGETFDQFLTLLTAQLRYQDPLSPMESTEFTSQLVQFASVEQSIRINDQLETLIEMQRNDDSATALGYIGHTVEVPGNVVTLKGGHAEIAYILDENARTTAISILDSAGQLVLAANGETVAGKHHFVWNGTSNTGVQLPDGEYRIAGGAETPDAVITIGPSPMGSMVRLVIDPDRHPAGESVAPRAVRAFEFADRTFGTKLGPNEPPRPAR